MTPTTPMSQGPDNVARSRTGQQRNRERRRAAFPESLSTSFWGSTGFFFLVLSLLFIGVYYVYTSNITHPEDVATSAIPLSASPHEPPQRLSSSAHKQQQQQQSRVPSQQQPSRRAEPVIVTAGRDGAKDVAQATCDTAAAAVPEQLRIARTARLEGSGFAIPARPEQCMRELDLKTATRNSKYFAATQYRLIPRSDSAGMDTGVFPNATFDECLRYCLKAGPANCGFFVRSVDPPAPSWMFGVAVENKSASDALHPRQARVDFLFSSFDDEERTHERREWCWLKVGFLDPVPNTAREIYVPAFVGEHNEIAVTPGLLSRTTGKFGCRTVANLQPTAVGRPAPSSLVAVGVLAGAPHLNGRVVPALRTWLKDEPNVVLFIDRTPAAIATVHAYLRSIAAVTVNRTTNPLFACVSASQLVGLHREYPEGGGDAFFSSDWDAELTGGPEKPPEHGAGENDGDGAQDNAVGEREVENRSPFPFFCNADEPQRPRRFAYKRPDVAGITAPIPTEKGSVGYTLFRFVREPYHQVLRHFNGAWKNFIILYELPLFYPTAAWYVSVDDDTMMLWRNLRYMLLLSALSMQHRRDDMYVGYLEYGSSIFFAHGGSGIVLSHGTLWRVHGLLPGCVALCRQPYGDVRVGCCMHGADIYERRIKSLWPYVLERQPERWTALTTSIHRYQKEVNITATYTALEREFARKTHATRHEFTKVVKDAIARVKQQTGREIPLERGPEFWATTAHRRLFFNARQWAWNATREQPSKSHFSDVPYRDLYTGGTCLFDELLFSAEVYRIASSARKLQ